mgnify:CR=1 FL=1
MKKLAVLALTLLLIGPSTALLGVAALGGTSATAAVCTPGSLAVGPIPDLSLIHISEPTRPY